MPDERKILEKMEAATVSPLAILTFLNNYRKLRANESGEIAESAISPVESLPDLDALPEGEGKKYLGATAILKLNGGLGTGMGLEFAKSLLEVRDGKTFLDLIKDQILFLRKKTGVPLPFYILNSFSTSEDTGKWLQQHPELDAKEILQNKVPKLRCDTLEPIEYPENPSLEWCPPGHGDLYASLPPDGTLQKLLDQGIHYLFVSNSDNLGATLDLRILSYFAKSGAPFMMEVTARTEADKKGGHLAVQNGRLILRESAQCPAADMEEFQNISKHRYFNTNNLWIHLPSLKAAMKRQGGVLQLPLIRNKKNVDPRDKNSPEVYQLETAMGAAIECFDGSIALNVPRTRFAPVKTTSDLFTLRSDAYKISDTGEIQLIPERKNIPPVLVLPDSCKFVDAMEKLAPNGVPSLKNCEKLVLKGELQFEKDVEITGNVEIVAKSAKGIVTSGRYETGRYEVDS